MEEKKLLRRFQCHLLLRTLLRSLIWGITAGAAAVFICAFIWHLKYTKPAPIWLWGSFAGFFMLGFMPCFILHFPTARRTARALDRSGLQERSGTMLAYAKADGLLVQMQRRDAAEHIRQAKPGQLKARFPVKTVIICAISVSLCIVMLLLPYDLFAPPAPAAPTVSQQEQQVHALIDDLRQQIRQAQLNEKTLQELEAILDQLEQDLLSAKSELEQAALIDQAQQNIQDTLFFSISRRAIGAAMQQYGLTEELGIQIAGDTPTLIHQQMEDLRKEISGPQKQITRLSNNLVNALESSAVDPSDSLYIAVNNFAVSLVDLVNYTEGPDDTPAWTMSDLAFAFELAEQNIVMALEDQAHTEAEISNLDATISSSLDSLLSQQGGEVLSGDKQQPEGQGGAAGSNNPSGGSDGSPSGTPIGGMSNSGDSDGTRTTMLEGIYDPVSGEVTYGEVFAAYYAQYLQALDAGEIPEELRPYFERYFSSLS